MSSKFKLYCRVDHPLCGPGTVKQVAENYIIVQHDRDELDDETFYGLVTQQELEVFEFSLPVDGARKMAQ